MFLTRLPVLISLPLLWSFGFPPALASSGTDALTPELGGLLGRFLNCDHDPYWREFRNMLQRSKVGVFDPGILGSVYHMWRKWNGWVDFLEEKQMWGHVKLFFTADTGEEEAGAGVDGSRDVELRSGQEEEARRGPVPEGFTMKRIENYQQLIDVITYAQHQNLFQTRFTDFSEQNIRVYPATEDDEQNEQKSLQTRGEDEDPLDEYNRGFTLQEASHDFEAKMQIIRKQLEDLPLRTDEEPPEELLEIISDPERTYLFAEERARERALFGDVSAFQAFLRCPVGYMITHYVVMTVQRVRGEPSSEELDLFWRNHMRIMNSLQGWPGFSLDFLDTGSWGRPLASSFDMFVNVKKVVSLDEDGEVGTDVDAPLPASAREFFQTYEHFFEQKPVVWDVFDAGVAGSSEVAVADVSPAEANHVPYRPRWLEILSKNLFVKILVSFFNSKAEEPELKMWGDFQGSGEHAHSVLAYFQRWTSRGTSSRTEVEVVGADETSKRATLSLRHTGNDLLLQTLFRNSASLLGVSEESLRWKMLARYIENALVPKETTTIPFSSASATTTSPYYGRLLALTSSPPVFDLHFESTFQTLEHTPIRICAFGEHGPTNMDYVSSIIAALTPIEQEEIKYMHNLQPSGGGSRKRGDDRANVEVEHYFSHRWNLKDTAQGDGMHIRVSWLEFWGMPLTKSQGNKHHVGTGPKLDKFFGSVKDADFGRKDVDYERTEPWTLSEAVTALVEYLAQDEFYTSADVLVGCEPFWLCPVLHEVGRILSSGPRNEWGGVSEWYRIGKENERLLQEETENAVATSFYQHTPLLLPRLNMCPMFLFRGHFKDEEGQEGSSTADIYRMMKRMLEDGAPLSSACRISAEMFSTQFKKEIPYVPFLGLHTAPAVYDRGGKRGSEILVFRTFLPIIHTFLHILNMFQAHFRNDAVGGGESPIIDGSGFHPAERDIHKFLAAHQSSDDEEGTFSFSHDDLLVNSMPPTPLPLRSSSVPEDGTTRFDLHPRQFVTMNSGENYPYQAIANYAAVVLLPHVPNALRLSDMQAMAVPVLVPAEPYIHKIVWPFAGPYCGRTSPEEIVRAIPGKMEERFQFVSSELQEDAIAAKDNNYLPDNYPRTTTNNITTLFDAARLAPQHPYSPFDFQSTAELLYERFHHDRRYWLRFTEWAERGHLLVKFSSVRHLYFLGMTLSDADFDDYSARMREDQEARRTEALGFWRFAVRSAIFRRSI
ncbi:unnamed protein product [Amoebophrya sp. A25]|nr:unnamed protein product [Amoebophrya sp. A25]|eukprot:GSA25T00019254001.1